MAVEYVIRWLLRVGKKTENVSYGEWRTEQMKDCVCGCGDSTAGGEFLPGHDQKLRAELERQIGGIHKLRELVERELGRPVITRKK